MTAPGFVQGVVVPPEVCVFLEQQLDLTRLRTTVLGDDPAIDHTLRAIRWAAMKYLGRADATADATETRPALEWLTPGQAATRLGVEGDTIRRAIREHRLPAEKHNGRWRITLTDLNAYRRR